MLVWFCMLLQANWPVLLLSRSLELVAWNELIGSVGGSLLMLLFPWSLSQSILHRHHRHNVQHGLNHAIIATSTHVSLMRLIIYVSATSYSAPVGEWSIDICLSVCPQAYLWNHWTDLHKIFDTDLLWLWLGPPLAALWYVRYFQFYGWCHV